jgi:phenylpyruvate tautomerase PptA (4-oxalocrotonate tautomerase family)
VEVVGYRFTSIYWVNAASGLTDYLARQDGQAAVAVLELDCAVLTSARIRTQKEFSMPFARIDLLKGKSPEYRATLADIVYEGIFGVLKAPDGDRFIVVSEHSPDNLIYDKKFLGFDRSPDFILIQVTSTVGNNKESKLAFFRYIADELKSKLSVRPDDIMINMVFVDRSDWSFGNGDPWT